MAHYDSPFAVGWELERQGGRGVGVGVYEEERQLTPNGEKWAISNQVPSAAQLATGQSTSVIRFLLTISPKSSRTILSVGNRHENNEGSLPGSSHHPSTQSTNLEPF